MLAEGQFKNHEILEVFYLKKEKDITKFSVPCSGLCCFHLMYLLRLTSSLVNFARVIFRIFTNKNFLLNFFSTGFTAICLGILTSEAVVRRCAVKRCS